jgi:hypothetical protein
MAPAVSSLNEAFICYLRDPFDLCTVRIRMLVIRLLPVGCLFCEVLNLIYT